MDGPSFSPPRSGLPHGRSQAWGQVRLVEIPHCSRVGPGHREAGFSVRPHLRSQSPHWSIQFHRPSQRTELCRALEDLERGRNPALSPTSANPAGRFEHGGGGSGSALEQPRGPPWPPKKRLPFCPSPLMIQGQASRGTKGHSHRPTLLLAPPGIKMPQARAAEFYLFFTFYEPSTALATTSF